METQTWLSCHNKFISAENITILSVSSDDFLHAFLEVADTGYSPEDLLEGMDNREWWRERVRDIRADGMMMKMMNFANE